MLFCFLDCDEQVENNEWLNDATKRHTIINLRSLKKRIGRVSDSKPTAIPTVEPPHPGLSYNPSFEDHQNLLKVTVEKEKKIIKEEQHLDRVTRDMLKKVSSTEKTVGT